MGKDITFLIPSMNGGGAEKVTMLVANELYERGWHITLLVSKFEGPYLYRLNKGINIKVLGNRNISKNIWEISQYLRKSRPSIFYSSMMYVNVIAGLSAKIAGYKGKLIFSEHSNISTMMENNSSSKIPIILYFAKKLYPMAFGVLCVSDGVKDDLQEHIKKIKKAVVIHNPVEDLFTKNIEKSSKYRLVSMGRLDRDKNFKHLILSFNEVLNEVGNPDNYELYIVGEGYERRNLEQLIVELKLQGKVILPGFLESPAEILHSSHLFVFPSVREGFGNVLVEALSCGLPIVSTDCPSGPSEILMDGKIGALVPVGDIKAMKNAIIKEIKQPNCISTVEERIARANDFSVKKVVDAYEIFFKG